MFLTEIKQYHIVGRGLAPAANPNKWPQHQTNGAAVNYLTYWNLTHCVRNGQLTVDNYGIFLRKMIKIVAKGDTLIIHYPLSIIIAAPER